MYFNNFVAYEEMLVFLRIRTVIEYYSFLSKKTRTLSQIFLWDSPSCAVLYINKFVRNTLSDPIKLFGKLIGQQGFGDSFSEAFSAYINLAIIFFC